MEFKDIVNLVPQLLILFIPGYIAVSISGNYKQEHKIDDKRLVILSILYSFLIETSLRIIIFIFFIFKTLGNISIAYAHSSIINKNNLFYIIAMLVMGLVTSCILTRFPSSKIFDWINKKVFDSDVLPCSTVWNKAMKGKDLWAKVYLKDENILYYGVIDLFSSNPNDNKREIFLRNYISYYLDTLDEIENYSDYTNNDNNKVGVWINTDTVKRIEILET